jgi:hypothetical protein
MHGACVMDVSLISALWTKGELRGSVLMGGVIGNWLASLGQWSGGQGREMLRRLTTDDLETLLHNHDLLRASRVAECRAMQAVCVRCLDQDYGQVVPLLKTHVSEKLWQRFTDPEIKAVIWWMKQFDAEAERAAKMSAPEWQKEVRLSLTDVPALLRASSEIGACENFDDLKERVTRAWVASLDSFARYDLERVRRLRLSIRCWRWA